VSYNPRLGLVFLNVSNLGMVGRMEPRATDPETGAVTSYRKTSPWGDAYARFWNPESRIPCSAPPFGELVAVDVNTGDVAWRVPLGIVEALAAKGIPDTGALTLGGSLATASGLVFIGATADRRFRAFDAKTGKELWVTKIDADAKAAPVTFMGRDGRQYVVVMAGGGLQLSRSVPALGSTLIAFALPSASAPPQRTAVGAPPPRQSPPAAASSSTSLPDGDGKALVERLCVGCHHLDVVTSARNDEQGWTRVIDDMAARGAAGTRRELDVVIAYLSEHFGKETQRR
ncbi:MAG: PQQ-binding-like beta-propeller repeat protein, partial [Vicinamibacteraceae bacterium]